MKIKKLVLRGFKRFALKESKQDLDLDINSRLVVIVGPNGSGKSSILKELSPCVSDKSAFTKDGYKELHISHNNKEYVIIQNYKDNTYSFQVDSVELNLSSNVSTQKELVYKHFGLNEFIEELLIGASNFTTFTPQLRKKLFELAVNFDIDKLLALYERAKEKQKTTINYITSTVSILNTEKLKLLDEEKEKEVNATIVSINSQIEQLLKIKDSISSYIDNNLDIDQIQQLNTEIYNKLNYLNTKYLYTTTSVDTQNKDSINEQLASTKAKLNNLYKDLQSLNKTKEELLLTKDLDINKLKTDLEQLLTKEKQLLSLVTYLDPTKDISSYRVCIDYLQSTITDVARELSLSPKAYTEQEYLELLQKKNQLYDQILELTKEKYSLQNHLEHLKNNFKEVNCPNCHHVWVLDNTDNKIKETTLLIQQILQKESQLQKQYEEVSKDLQKASAYLELLQKVSNSKKTTNATLTKYWSEVATDENIRQNPQILVNSIKELQQQLLYTEQLLSVQNKIKEINSTINTINSNCTLTSSSIDKKLSDIEFDIATLQQKLQTLQLHLDLITTKEKIVKARTDLLERLRSSISELDSYIASTIAKTVNDQINAEITRLRAEVVNYSLILQQQKTLKSTIESLQSKINQHQQDLQVYELVAKELNPKTGLIAKYTTDFINYLITNINKTIESVWDYKMTLEPLDLNSESLNYKFRVNIEDRLTVDDISKTSSGMQEIINFSFKLVLMKMLKLQNYPLFLDEFGTKLDKSHKSKIFSVISSILNSTNYSNIFMITHVDTSYLNYKDVQIVDLSH